MNKIFYLIVQQTQLLVIGKIGLFCLYSFVSAGGPVEITKIIHIGMVSKVSMILDVLVQTLNLVTGTFKDVW